MRTRLLFAATAILASLMLIGPATAAPVTTGGGWIPGLEEGGKATFGFTVVTKQDGSFDGHFTLTDHTTGQKVKATPIAASSDGCSAQFIAVSDTDIVIVDVTDNGEPGRDDTITIQGTYNNSGTLGGGNIQVPGEDC